MINEVGFLENMFEVIGDCVIYIYYIEGVGGGYVLDIMKFVFYVNILLLFIMLIIFYIVNMMDEYFDMMMVCYYLDVKVFEDVVFSYFRIRVVIIVVEDIFYDIGVISMILLDF